MFLLADVAKLLTQLLRLVVVAKQVVYAANRLALAFVVPIHLAILRERNIRLRGDFHPNAIDYPLCFQNAQT